MFKKLYVDLRDCDIERIKNGGEYMEEGYLYDKDGAEQTGEMVEVIVRKEPNEHLNHE